MAISMENSPLHDLPPGTTLYFSEEYHDHDSGLNCRACYSNEPYQFGGLVTSTFTDADGDRVTMTVPERMVMDYYEANWELGAMHCSGEDCDDAQTF